MSIAPSRSVRDVEERSLPSSQAKKRKEESIDLHYSVEYVRVSGSGRPSHGTAPDNTCSYVPYVSEYPRARDASANLRRASLRSHKIPVIDR